MHQAVSSQHIYGGTNIASLPALGLDRCTDSLVSVIKVVQTICDDYGNLSKAGELGYVPDGYAHVSSFPSFRHPVLESTMLEVS